MRIRHAIAAISLFVSVNASAQVGTYRPGSPYTALPAPAPDSCERTCAGDAGCKGWNFVEMRDGGVCELNSLDVSPVPSPNAVSGAGTALHPASTRIVRLPDAPTVRIGQPVKKRIVSNNPVAKRVVEPVPRRMAAQPAGGVTATRSIAPMRPVAKPRFSHALESAPTPIPSRIRPAPVSRPAVPAPRPVLQPSMAPQAVVTPQARPVQPVPQPAPMGHAPAPVAAMPIRPVTQESLFGSLYDDVAVPAPTKPVELADPSAPVATSESRSVSGLAGN